MLVMTTACGKKAALEAKADEAHARLLEQREQMEKLRKESDELMNRKVSSTGTRQEQEIRKRIDSAKARKDTLDEELEQARASLKKIQETHQAYRSTHL